MSRPACTHAWVSLCAPLCVHVSLCVRVCMSLCVGVTVSPILLFIGGSEKWWKVWREMGQWWHSLMFTPSGYGPLYIRSIHHKLALKSHMLPITCLARCPLVHVLVSSVSYSYGTCHAHICTVWMYFVIPIQFLVCVCVCVLSVCVLWCSVLTLFKWFSKLRW